MRLPKIKLIDIIGQTETDNDLGIFFMFADMNDSQTPMPFELIDDFINTNNYSYLDNDYFLINSGEKYLSRYTARWLNDYIVDHYSGKTIYDWKSLTDIQRATTLNAFWTYVTYIIYNRFGYKWKKIYDALTTDYKPLENYNMFQKRTPDITREDTYDTTDERTPNLTTSGEDSAKTDVGIYGFNSTSGNNSTDSNGESSSSQSVTGTDTNTKTGTITNTESGTEELERSGNIGVTTSQQMLESELKLREYDFYKTIYKDIDSILCLGIY